MFTGHSREVLENALSAYRRDLRSAQEELVVRQKSVSDQQALVDQLQKQVDAVSVDLSRCPYCGSVTPAIDQSGTKVCPDCRKER